MTGDGHGTDQTIREMLMRILDRTEATKADVVTLERRIIDRLDAIRQESLNDYRKLDERIQSLEKDAGVSEEKVRSIAGKISTFVAAVIALGTAGIRFLFER